VKKQNLNNTTYVHYQQEEHGEVELFKLLNPEEQQRAAAFKFEAQRSLYIKAHVFLRKVLSYHTGHPPEAWQFHKNDYGKPFISNAEFRSIQFNLSHTKGMIVCAVSKQCVGIDVEGSRPLNHIKQISQRHFTAKEYEDIFLIQQPEKQLHRFYTYWTLKEAFVKAIGFGLSIPLKKIGFIQLKNNDWILGHAVELLTKGTNSNWFFFNKFILNDYQVSIAIDSKKDIDMNIIFINSVETKKKLKLIVKTTFYG